MNLRAVHAFLILLSAALAVVFGIWCLRLYTQQEGVNGVGPLIAGITAFAVSVGLIVYDSWFLRKTRRLR